MRRVPGGSRTASRWRFRPRWRGHHRADAQRRLDALLEDFDAVVWEDSPGGGPAFVSANAADVLGCPPDALSDPDRLAGRAHPADADAVARARARNAEGHGTETRLRFRDDSGHHRRIRERVSVTLNPDGTVLRRRGVIVDESELWDAESDLRRYSDFIQGIPIALLILSVPDPLDPASLEVRAMNPAAHRLLGTDESAVPGTLHGGGILPEELLGELAAVVGRTGPLEKPFVELSGSDAVFALRAVPLPDDHIGLSLEDVTKRARLEETFRHQAMHDPLTGLPNRAALQARLGDALAGTAGGNGKVALLLVDLDQFKEVNDALGHEYGDRLLSEFGRRLSDNLRQCDLIARLGGDEFAVLVSDGVDEDVALDIAARLLQLTDRKFEVGDFRFQIGASVGIAVAPTHGSDAKTLLRRADTAMYHAKARGGGAALYSPGQALSNVRRLELMGDLRDAVRSDALEVHYQPRIDLGSLRTVGVEALVRWRHPRHGLLPPDEFIELAVVSGAIHQLTRRVGEKAANETRALLDRHRLSLSINLSARNLRDDGLTDWVEVLIDDIGLEAGTLWFEITESELMDDPSRSLGLLQDLRDLGVRFSVDDFGTGYSSLSYLRQLPIDEIKIDRSFVADLRDDDTIVRSVIDLGHNLGLHVVAEGVEDAHTVELLTALGCDSAQGFLWGAPMPARELAHHLGGAWEPVGTERYPRRP